MSEHVEAAKGSLRDAEDYQNDWHSLRCEVKPTVYDKIRWARDMMQVSAQVAQAEATLAVAEQLRIGNIVALGALQIASSMDGYNSLVGDGGAFRTLYPGGSNTPLHPEIARALGLGVGDE